MIVCFISIGIYETACVVHWALNGISGEQQGVSLLVNNSFFLVLFSIISATSSYFSEKLRFREFKLQFDLDGSNKELEASYKKLEELDQAKSRFFANISHELRTPLTLIISPLGELQNDPRFTDDPALQETTEVMYNNALRLLSLINDPLDLVRLEEGRLQIQVDTRNGSGSNRWQEDGMETRQRQGTGIGLALVKEIVEHHHGTVTVKSKKGKGTIFCVTLPRTDERPQELVSTERSDQDGWVVSLYDEAQHAQGKLLAHDATESDDAFDPLKHSLLIIEDEPDMRKFLKSELGKIYNISLAADGQQGLDLALEHEPDLILSDMMLPTMNGITLCQRLKARPAPLATKIILLTARADDTTKLAALQAGADDFMTKPFSTIELKTRLANILLNARLEKELQLQNTKLEETLTQLQNTEAQLIQSQKMSGLGSLTAGIMHEINNPVNFMITAVHYLKGILENPAEETVDTIKDIEDGLNRIRDIIKDLKGFAYESSPEDLKPCDPEKIWRTTKRLLAHEMNGAEIEEHIDNSEHYLWA